MPVSRDNRDLHRHHGRHREQADRQEPRPGAAEVRQEPTDQAEQAQGADAGRGLERRPPRLLGDGAVGQPRRDLAVLALEADDQPQADRVPGLGQERGVHHPRW
jgi:hypothetical protein